MTTRLKAEIGVIGGSGFYSLLDGGTDIVVDTPYGAPSDVISLGQCEGKSVAFLARHGQRHTIPPHRVNSLANIWALKSLGVRFLISPCAVGSLQPEIHPGDFVVCDQYVDRTRGRADTFYNGPAVYHVSAADPYCPHLRSIAVRSCRSLGVATHEAGAIVVINGPRFSTRAESQWFTSAGFSVVGMTQYPEVHLALEQEIAPVNISLVTDYDCGLVASGMAPPVTTAEVIEVFTRNSERVKEVSRAMIRDIPLDLASPCHSALSGARIGG